MKSPRPVCPASSLSCFRILLFFFLYLHWYSVWFPSVGRWLPSMRFVIYHHLYLSIHSGPARQNLLPKSLCILRKRGQTPGVLAEPNLRRSAVQRRFQPQSLCYCFPSVKWSNRYLMYQKQFVQQFFSPIQGCAWLAEGSPYLSEANPFSHCAPTLSFYSWGALRLHAGPEMGPQSQWPLGVCVGKCAEQMLKSL